MTPKAGEKVDKHRLTQVGRAMKELGVQMIAAYSPQARGRWERSFGTWQGRLPQELRLAGIDHVWKPPIDSCGSATSGSSMQVHDAGGGERERRFGAPGARTWTGSSPCRRSEWWPKTIRSPCGIDLADRQDALSQHTWPEAR